VSGSGEFYVSVVSPPPGSVSLKCDPDLAAGLRTRYAAITPGYHLNKRHWNTVALDGSVPRLKMTRGQSKLAGH
jgi:predicted DNA-binding protein (MmcQ/YjbR family)